MTVFMDRPNGAGWAHLLSDLPGEAGTTELKTFTREAGILRRLQSPGTYSEHYDIRGADIHLAEASGANVATRREIALILRNKKSGTGSDK